MCIYIHIYHTNIYTNLSQISKKKSYIGCLLTIKNADDHRTVIYKRGEVTKKGAYNLIYVHVFVHNTYHICDMFIRDYMYIFEFVYIL
jgi:hypothetical protein